MLLRLLALCAVMACGSRSPAPSEVPRVVVPSASQGTGSPVDAIAAAVSNSSRPEDDVMRDAAREPLKILKFVGVKPGWVVADLMAGRGYYTELLARSVGPKGKIYAQNNQYVNERFADKAMTERLARPGLQNVQRVTAELEDLGLPEGRLDAAFMGLFYHDSVWMKADRARMNASIFAALKPGATLVITDHHAEAGSGTRDVKTLHRIERDIVVQELTAAGFVLDAESDALRHPEDDRTVNVFDDAIRGQTDRFVLRFVKPAT